MLANLSHYHIKISKGNFYRYIITFLLSYIFWIFIFMSIGKRTIIDSIDISIGPAILTGLFFYLLFKNLAERKIKRLMAKSK